MSKQNLLPDPQSAFDHVFSEVHQRVFFSKCAAAGLPARNQQEAEWMLNTAGNLRQLEQVSQTKQAADTDNPYYQANAALNQLMTQMGFAQPQPAEQVMAIKSAAADLAQNPDIYNSILALKAAEAQQIQEELAAWQAAQLANG